MGIEDWIEDQGKMRLTPLKLASFPRERGQGTHVPQEHKSCASLHCQTGREIILVSRFHLKWPSRCQARQLLDIWAHQQLRQSHHTDRLTDPV